MRRDKGEQAPAFELRVVFARAIARIGHHLVQQKAKLLQTLLGSGY
jgi:hypothetical protein